MNNHRNPEALFQEMKETVDSLIEARVKFRHLYSSLSALVNDASGIAFTDNYQDGEIQTVRDFLYALDHLVGIDFRAIERLRESLEKKRVK